MSELKNIGYSNKIFYYNGVGETNSFDFCAVAKLKEELDKKAFEKAVGKALEFFPEFAFRPVIKDNKLYAEENRADIKVLEEEKVYSLGSSDTGGYLFCFLYKDKRLQMSFFHGLSDFAGFLSFFGTIVFLYAKELGLDLCPIRGMRKSLDEYYAIPEAERLDPYSCFMAEKYEAKKPKDIKEICEIDVPLFGLDSDVNKNYDIVFNQKALSEAIKKHNTSFTAFIISLISKAVRSIAKDSEKTVRVKLPANIRKLFSSSSLVNFSDSLIIEQEADIYKFDDMCKDVREKIDESLKPEYFALKMRQKSERVKEYEKSGKAIEKIAEETAKEGYLKNTRPVTYSLSTLGDITLPEDYGVLIESLGFEPHLPTENVFILILTYGGRTVLRLCQRFESDILAKQIALELKSMGIETEVEDRGYTRGNKVIIENIKHI
ncbi:MAG: hypothetical protein IJS61_10135 [Firmicutes bacterium]|nr:hypothetical protein [Bacillota bacterium]